MQQYQSENVNELAKALLSVQRNLQPAVKDATNPFVKNRYASLNSVMEVCKEPLLEHGIWLCQYLVQVENETSTGSCLGLMTKLTHAESGQWQSSLAVIPLPKADPQGMGSAITYARRYALSAMLGIVTEDDDAESAKLSPKRASPAKQLKNTPIAQDSPQGYAQVGNRKTPTSNQAPQHNAFAHLPRIDGVTYQEGATKDGRIYIVATGNTQAKKELLKGAGFQWNPQNKAWWRYADIA